jgi:hypothetical protein
MELLGSSGASGIPTPRIQRQDHLGIGARIVGRAKSADLEVMEDPGLAEPTLGVPEARSEVRLDGAGSRSP